jgi:recombination protein RecT
MAEEKLTNQQGIIKAAAASKPASSGKRTIQNTIERMMPEIKKALPNTITPERFTRITLSALSNNPTLKLCSELSFLSAMMTSAQLGLEPNTPLQQAYIIPYKNHGNYEAQFQIGYKGLIDLAYRSGQVKTIYAEAVHENDTFEYELGLNPKLVHVPADRNRGEVTHYYAVFKLVNGGEGMFVASKDDILKHAEKYSKSYAKDTSPWKSNFDEMAKKTVIKQVLKYAPLSTDFMSKLTADETIHKTISDDMTLEPNETDWIDAETGEVKEAEVVHD